MTYNEWRDELKSNLLCVSEAERRRVLDYYAEAYADRREAGFTEKEIIEYFGAPYDAAQRILGEGQNVKDYYEQPQEDKKFSRREERERMHAEKERQRRERNSKRADDFDDVFYENGNQGNRYDSYDNASYNSQSAPPYYQQNGRREDYSWVFVLLCILFAIPIFWVVMAMVGITIGFCVAPVAVLISGIASVGAGIGQLFFDPISGAINIGTGLIIFGVSLILMPLCFRLVKWMWKLFRMFFAWLKRFFSGREKLL